MSLFAELKRRNVFKVGATYLVVAWLLLQVADIVFEAIGAADWVMQALLVVVALGFPLTLIGAWAFEMTPEGLKRDEEVDHSASPVPARSFNLNHIIIGGLVLVVAWFLFDEFYLERGAGQGPERSQVAETGAVDNKSIAVLPFETFSGDESDQYFADGLADTLLHKLAQIADLKVIARNSSFQFKGSNRDVREIGEFLGASTILEGSVQRSGEQVRIIAQLINAADGAHIWSQSFDDQMDNIFDLQDRIATAVANELQVTITKEEADRLRRAGTDSVEAYDLLMRALAVDMTQSDRLETDAEEFESIQLLERALEIDPDYAMAWAQLSEEYNALAWVRNTGPDFERYVQKQREAAETALRLDPQLDVAHKAMGFAEWRVQNVREAQGHFRRALELNPNGAGAAAGLGLTLMTTDAEQALALFRRNSELNPTNSLSHRQMHMALMKLGRFDEAIVELETAIEKDPEEAMYYDDLADIYESMGRPDEAALLLTQVLRLRPNDPIAAGSMVDTWVDVLDTERVEGWLNVLRSAQLDLEQVQMVQAMSLLASGAYGEALKQLNAIGLDGAPVIFNVSLLKAATCLKLEDAECARQSAQMLRTMVNRMVQRGFDIASYLIYVDVLDAVAAIVEGGSVSDRTLEELRERAVAMPAFSYFPGPPRKGYLLAGVLAMQGDTKAALAALEETLNLPNGGFYGIDFTGLPAEHSVLLSGLRGEPGFEDWLARYKQRREDMRQSMRRLEREGQIALPPDKSAAALLP